ncbi:MAG: heavy metal translocating P-type ATPase, partial [Aquificaceae bacterium]|nr:heavy metal translocating P-type ATPase [Aquificaceae bacterium]
MTKFTIERLSNRSLKLHSYIFEHLQHPEESIREHFSRFGEIRELKYYPHSGKVRIDFDESFDLTGFLNYIQETSRELLLKELSQLKLSKRERQSSLKELLMTTAGFLPYLFRGSIPGTVLSGITLFMARGIIKKAIASLKRSDLDVHVLDASAIVMSCFSGSPLSAQVMVFLLNLGDYLSSLVESKAYEKIEKLFSYKEDMAWKIAEDGQVIRVKAIDLSKGELIAVYAGEKIPVDGVVKEGDALVNQASLTGESNPVHKKAGDKVYAGTFVEDGKLYINVEEVGENTVVAKIARIVEESIKEPINLQQKAHDFANKFVVPTIGLGLGAWVISRNTSRLSSALIIDFHTGVHLTTPLTVLSGIAKASELGILIKSGSKLEALSKVDMFVMDKTGTLTVGNPVIEDVVGLEISEEEVLRYSASLEQRITHPVARAILKLAESRSIELLQRENSQYHIGLGIEANINDEKFMLGSTRFMNKKHVKISQEVRKLVDKFHSEAKSVLYLVKDKKIVGLLTFKDPLREEAKDVVSELKKRGKEVILCTGDNEGIASYISKQLGLSKFYARVFPAEKAKVVSELKAAGNVVAFVGDGVNDSPALSCSDVGISLKSGTDIAIDVADIVIGDSLWHLVDALDISTHTMKKLKRTYFVNTLLNMAGLIGAVSGLSGPSISTLLNNGATIAL